LPGGAGGFTSAILPRWTLSSNGLTAAARIWTSTSPGPDAGSGDLHDLEHIVVAVLIEPNRSHPASSELTEPLLVVPAHRQGLASIVWRYGAALVSDAAPRTRAIVIALLAAVGYARWR